MYLSYLKINKYLTYVMENFNYNNTMLLEQSILLSMQFVFITVHYIKTYLRVSKNNYLFQKYLFIYKFTEIIVQISPFL
jgi:hypothetical protein